MSKVGRFFYIPTLLCGNHYRTFLFVFGLDITEAFLSQLFVLLCQNDRYLRRATVWLGASGNKVREKSWSSVLAIDALGDLFFFLFQIDCKMLVVMGSAERQKAHWNSFPTTVINSERQSPVQQAKAAPPENTFKNQKTCSTRMLTLAKTGSNPPDSGFYAEWF